IRTMHRHLRTLGWHEDGQEWDQFIGMRADEMHRVAKIRARGHSTELSRELMCVPLADAGVTKQDVMRFWSEQPFDLQLPSRNGVAPHGNCDLCFLKPAAQVQSLIAEDPRRAVWWIAQEAYAKGIQLDKDSTGVRFRWDRRSYADMANFVDRQGDLFSDL